MLAGSGAMVLFAMALALAFIAALQGQARPLAPSIPLIEQRIQPKNGGASAPPAAPATVAPLVVPAESETTPVTPAGEAGDRPNPTEVPVPAPAPAGAPASAPPAAQPKVAPADGRPMGDLEPRAPSTRDWKGGFDY